MKRREFLGKLSGVAATSLTAGAVGVSTAADAAKARNKKPFPATPTNGDEESYSTKIASYTKGLPHNDRGEVDLSAYGTFLKAITTGKHADFEAVPLGGRAKFANPQAAYASSVEGFALHELVLSIPPTFSRAETASEMVELYWQALTRDVPFTEYVTHPLTTAAAADLSRCSDFHGPQVRKTVTPATLFRGPTPGELIGPYLSQFLRMDVDHGSMTLMQRSRVPVAHDDYMRTYPEWLNIQRGLAPARINVLDATPRYLRNGRDLAECKDNPPALPGDSQSLTIAGVGNSLHSVNRSKVNGKETVHGRVSEPKPYEMGMQISRGVYPQVPAQSVVRTVAQPSGGGVSRIGAAEGEPHRRGASAARSCAHAAGDSAQVCGGAGGGLAEGEERHSHRPDVWRPAAQFSGGTLLGPGVLCLDGGAR